MCNDHIGNHFAGPDPLSGEVIRLFDSRHQSWADHFDWNALGDMIIGKPPIGRATVFALRLNRVDLVEARRGWVIAGWHPPSE
jgi:hypothetical protein